MKTNTIHCGDCVQVMQDHIPDNSIDLTVTSPPYDQMTETYDLIPTLRDYNGYSLNFADLAGQLWRVTKPGGVVVWVVGDATIDGSETGTSFRQALYFMGLGFKLHDTMIYQKSGAGAAGSMKCYLQSFEFMFIFSKKPIKTFNVIRDRQNISGGIKRKTPYRYGQQVDGQITIEEYGRRLNIWKITNTQGDASHPAPFPEALARDHIISWSNPGDIVLDPMCGSGTTLKMAKELGRQWIGIDISQEYVDLAWRRVDGARVPHPAMLDKPKAQPEPVQIGFAEQGG